MFLWCAYCQTFLGETEPKSDLQMTHGICHSCKARYPTENESLVSRAAPMRNFFATVRSDLIHGTNRKPAELLRQGKALGIARLDMLVGLMQPLLVEIVKLQKEEQLDVCGAHEFSKMIEGFFHEIQKDRKPVLNPAVILTCADGNYHSFGVRLIEEYLLSQNIPTKCFYPSLPFAEIIQTAEKLKAQIIGVSGSSFLQIESVVEEWREYLKNRARESSLSLIVGGPGVTLHTKLPNHCYAHLGSLENLKTCVETLLLPLNSNLRYGKIDI